MKCFLIEQTGSVEVEITASFGERGHCPKNPYEAPHESRHHARHVVFSGPDGTQPLNVLRDNPIFDGAREFCGAPGVGLRANGSGTRSIWQRRDTGETHRRIADFGVGAMWFADWYKSGRTDSSGRALYGWDWDNQFDPPLMVRTLGGDWDIDSRASNCTQQNDKLHRCWIRHGEPPSITVDKNGLTCSAGAGSIQCGNYHGFLRNGEFTV